MLVVCIDKCGELLTKEWVCKCVVLFECKINQGVRMLPFYQFPFRSFAIAVLACLPLHGGVIFLSTHS